MYMEIRAIKTFPSVAYKNGPSALENLGGPSEKLMDALNVPLKIQDTHWYTVYQNIQALIFKA